jgi:hypothetical protein
LVEAAKQAVGTTAQGEAVRFTQHPFKKVTLLSSSPLVLEIEDFLLDKMLQKVLASTKKGTWERSITIDEFGNEVHDDPNRTSSTMSLVDAVLSPSDLASIKRLVARFTGFEEFDIEYPVTLVMYQKDEFYNAHHDAGTVMFKNGNPCEDFTSATSIDDLVVAIPDDQPVRMVSLFVYLKTHAAGTSFPWLGLTTEAKAGKCVLFANYCPTLGRLDPRAIHAGVRLDKAAVPKFGLNIFVTMPPLHIHTLTRTFTHHYQTHAHTHTESTAHTVLRSSPRRKR